MKAPRRTGQVWIDSFFTPETEFADLQRAVYNFEKSIPQTYWDPAADPGWAAAAAAPFQPELDSLAVNDQYEGRQWISASYRSFDLQAPDRAVVTVRETWQDTRYQRQGDYPEESDPILGRRGPYPLDVTFTLEKTDGIWQVTRVVLNSAPPPWQ